MRIEVMTQIGNAKYKFFIDESNDKEALLTASILGEMPQICDCCDNIGVVGLVGNKDKDGNVYINIVCKKCGAKAKLGSYKNGGYFWHRFEKWEGRKKEEVSERTTQAPQSSDVNWNE